MAPTIGRETAALIERLFAEPHRFDFFQAVRILERLGRELGERHTADARLPVGEDHPPDREAVRFRAAPALSFPPAAISRLHLAERGGRAEGGPSHTPPEMTVTHVGLTGPSGVLPDHYTALVIERLRRNDRTLADFLDLFHHRTISLFYRVWRKHHLAAAYEHACLEGHEGDALTQVLYCLVGRGTRGLRRRMSVDDETTLYYGGLFAHRLPNAVSLAAMLADRFAVPVCVQQFRGQWLQIADADRSRLVSRGGASAGYNRLGVDTVLGDRVWDVEGMFRLRVGPLASARFRAFMPDGAALRALSELTRAYVGPQLEFDVQVVQRSGDIPACRLSSHTTSPSRLGWNSWLRSPGDEAPRSAEREIDDAVFRPIASLVP
jgi:type VI secretion system protein ImpH